MAFNIGVVLKENYRQEEGGGFSYYDSLVKGIDDKIFNSELNFIFINFTETKLESIKNKKIICFKSSIPPNSEVHLKHFLKANAYFLFRILRKIKSIIYQAFTSPSEKTLSDLNQEKINWLINNKIHVLYYLIPEMHVENFPYVITHWDIGHYSTFAFPETTMLGKFESREFLYERIHKKAFSIFCESESGKKELSHYKNINSDRIRIVPIFPSEIVDYKIDIESQVNIIENKFQLKRYSYFIYPAQFWAHKNHYNLVKAFKKLLFKYPDLKLILPGSDKGNMPYIKDYIAELSIFDSVIVPGFITKDELFSLYKNALALVMPTFLGPTNMPLLEAAFLGCKVITSNIDGHREILGDYGIYIDPLYYSEIYNAMERVINEKDSLPTPFNNKTNTINSALNAINDNFLYIKNIRNTFGFNFDQG